MAELVAVSRVKAGVWPSVRWWLATALGARPCFARALSNGLFGVRPAWATLVEAMSQELGHTLSVLPAQPVDEEISRASAGREPCVLIRDDHGGVSMIADWNDLAAARGKVDVFERIIRSKLLMY
jgi:hypothetical protein